MQSYATHEEKKKLKSCLTGEIISEHWCSDWEWMTIVGWEIASSCSFTQSHGSLAMDWKPVDQAHLSPHVSLWSACLRFSHCSFPTKCPSLSTSRQLCSMRVYCIINPTCFKSQTPLYYCLTSIILIYNIYQKQYVGLHTNGSETCSV